MKACNYDIETCNYKKQKSKKKQGIAQQRFAAIGVLVLALKLVLYLEDWFLIYSFGLSNPQLQQATGVGGNATRPTKQQNNYE